MSEYDSLKVISHPPFYRWVGLPDYYQELTGSPKFLCASLHTCHALRTPADPPESRLFSARASPAKN
ncbi:MAG: hypothetical protein K8R06_09875 [Methanosarcinales archaeon]|nr:hypothetical protein [Methanosarcinales archaeon]